MTANREKSTPGLVVDYAYLCGPGHELPELGTAHLSPEDADRELHRRVHDAVPFNQVNDDLQSRKYNAFQELVLAFANILQCNEESVIATAASITATSLDNQSLHLFVAANSNRHRASAGAYLQKLWNAFQTLVRITSPRFREESTLPGRDAVKESRVGTEEVQAAKKQIVLIIMRYCWRPCIFSLIECVSKLVPLCRPTVSKDSGWLDHQLVPPYGNQDGGKEMSARQAIRRMSNILRYILTVERQESIPQPHEHIEVKSKPDHVADGGVWAIYCKLGSMQQLADTFQKTPGFDAHSEGRLILMALGHAVSAYKSITCLFALLKSPHHAPIMNGTLRVTWYCCPSIERRLLTSDRDFPGLQGGRLDASTWVEYLCRVKTDIRQQLEHNNQVKEKIQTKLQEILDSAMEPTPKMHAEMILFLGLVLDHRLDACRVLGISQASCFTCYVVVKYIWGVLEKKYAVQNLPRFVSPEARGPSQGGAIKPELLAVGFTAHALHLSDDFADMMEEVLVHWIERIVSRALMVEHSHNAESALLSDSSSEDMGDSSAEDMNIRVGE